MIKLGARLAAMAALGFVAGIPAVQPASAQGAGPFAGKSISAVVNYQNKIRVNGRDFDAPMKFDLNLNISGDGVVTGSGTRSSEGLRGPISRSQSISATIGKPREVRGSGNAVILVSGNTLTILRTFEVGGVKITVTMQGGGRCSITCAGDARSRRRHHQARSHRQRQRGNIQLSPGFILLHREVMSCAS